MQLFDEQWCAAASRALKDLESSAAGDAVIGYTISGGGVPRRSLTVTVRAGTVAEVVLGKPSAPDIEVSLGYDDAVAILAGEMSGDAGYMSGAIKVEGDYPRWLLDLRPLRLAAVESLAELVSGSRAL